MPSIILEGSLFGSRPTWSNREKEGNWSHTCALHNTGKLLFFKPEMWANAQRDGYPAEYRWCPLFNAAKFGWRPILECRAVKMPRSETCWNLQVGCSPWRLTNSVKALKVMPQYRTLNCRRLDGLLVTQPNINRLKGAQSNDCFTDPPEGTSAATFATTVATINRKNKWQGWSLR